MVQRPRFGWVCNGTSSAGCFAAITKNVTHAASKTAKAKPAQSINGMRGLSAIGFVLLQ
ncbi:MAG: hypothetical protein QM715_20685 [Nibricoccus sp.]